MSQTTTITVPDSLPWRWSAPASWNTLMINADDECILKVQGGSVSPDDARYIIHAANLYPVLLKALEKVKANRICTDTCETEMCSRCGEHIGWPTNSMETPVCDDCVIDAALTQAREPEGT